MANDKEVLLHINLKADDALKSVTAITERVTKLKESQKALNTSTTEGKIQYAAYQGQITNLTKEKRSLENAIAQTAGAFNFESGSIAANRAELSKLTAEYKNLAAPTKEQTDRIKVLSETLKQQEGAIGQAQRNVGNYTESIQAAGLGNTQFGKGLTVAQEGFGKLKSGIDLAKTGFTTLKGAIAATGIGLLLVAFTALVDYFKSSDEGATQLEGALKAVGAITDVLAKGLVYVKDAIFSVVNDPKQAIIDLGNLVKENLINRLTAFLVIYEGIKNGDFTKVADGLVQAGTGIENASGKITALKEGAKKLADELAVAAKEGYNLALAFDDLDDRQRDYLVTNAQSNKQISQLLLQMKNKTNSQQESLDLAAQAAEIELSTFKQNKAFAVENVSLIEKENNLKLARLGITKEQIAAATSEADRSALVGKLAGEYAQKEIDARVRVINLEQESLVVQEKIQNRIDSIKEAAAAKRKAEAEKAAKELEDQLKREEEYYNKRRAMVAQADNEENARTAFKLNQDVKNAELRIAAQQFQSDKLIKNEQLTSEQRIQIATDNLSKTISLIDERSRAEADAINQLAAIQSESGVNTALIEQERAQKIIDIHRKAADDKAKLEESTTDKIKSENDKQQKIDELRNRNAVALASSTAGSLAGLFKEQTIAYRVFASVQALIDTYRAAQAAYASAAALPLIGYIAGPVAAGIAVAAGLANVAKINNAAGFAEGVIGLEGPGTETSDSIPVNLSKGESVMTAKETRMFRPQLMRMRQISTGRLISNPSGNRFANGVIAINDGGIGPRNAATPVYTGIDAMNNTLKIINAQKPPIVLVSDINNAQDRLADVKQLANV